MRKIIYLSLLLFVFSNNNYANTRMISGKIIDFVSKKGISKVHIYSANLNQGTITNDDGNFSILVSKDDKLHISYIGYQEQIIKLSENATDNLVIEMKLKIESLDEIVINAKVFTIEEILTKVIKSFKKNHLVEPAYYKFYSRLINYSKDSTLNSVEEYNGTIRHNRLHNTTYNIEKARVKYLTKDSVAQLKEHRVIAMNKMYIDNIYKYREDYLKKKGKRIYEFKLRPNSKMFGRDCYVISYDTEKDNYDRRGEFYVDLKDFAIVRKVLRNSNNIISKDITFQKENDKWYLKKAEDYHVPYGESIYSTDYRITLYNYVDIEDSNLKLMNLSVQYSTKITSEFNDDFWKNNNFIPLPSWIKQQIK